MIKILCKYDAVLSLEEIIENPKNPNKHSEDQIKTLSKIINYYGVRHPIIISKQTGLVIVGHGRKAAAKDLGMKDFPVVFQDFESEEIEYQFMCADNAIADWANLDLSMINAELPNFSPDFDIECLGIKGFMLDPSEKIVDIVNSGDENSEWVGMPEFQKGDSQIRVIIVFKTELERDMFIKNKEIIINKKINNNNWICYK